MPRGKKKQPEAAKTPRVAKKNVKKPSDKAATIGSCPVCGLSVLPSGSSLQKVYCSPLCRRRAARSRRYIRKRDEKRAARGKVLCRSCGDPIDDPKPNQLYHDKQCRDDHRRLTSKR